jgi:hypothetical protein
MKNNKEEEKLFSNDATTKLLGYDYQKLIALEHCLNGKKNSHIWIECKGDLADNKTSFEIKHHLEATTVTNNSVDVWKTIKNYITEIQVVQQFEVLILHTTSQIAEDSIFYSWNNKTPAVKKDILLQHVPAKTIQEFYGIVRNCSVDALLEILSKFSIHSNQPNIKQKWIDLRDHSVFKIIPSSLVDAAIQHLYGYITKIAIDNSNEWKISINDFNRDIQHVLCRFARGYIPFPVVPVDSSDLSLNRRDFVFIEKLKAIRIKERDQANAVSDFLRANMSQIKLLSQSPTIEAELNNYDVNVQRFLDDNKSKYATDLSQEVIETEQANKISRELYFDSLGKNHESIAGVENTQKYYRDGRIHHIAEETFFDWRFKEEEL